MSQSGDKKEIKLRPPIAAKERGPGPGRYSLPSTFGKEKADCTKHIEPSYTFGTKLGSSLVTKTRSPGPGYFIDPKYSRYGAAGNPSYTMSSRTKPLNTFNGPPPGSYSPEKAALAKEGKAPSYTMAARTPLLKPDSTPAPSTYTIPTLMGTTSISGKASAPTYSISGRPKIGGFADDHAHAPGPGNYVVPAADVVKGKSPAYSMGSRTFMPDAGTKTPGPGAHDVEKVRVNKHKSPAFSMGVRHSDYTTPLIIDVAE